MDNLIDEFQAQLEMIKDNHYLTDAEIIKQYEDKILTLKNSILSYYFSKNITGANIKVHRKIVIESKNIGYNLLFALLDSNNIKIHEKIILESKDKYYMFLWALMTPNAKEVSNAIIETCDIEYIYKCAKDLDRPDIAKYLEKAIINSKDPKYNYLFAKNIEDANIQAHRQAIIDNGNLKYLQLINEICNSDKEVRIYKKQSEKI